MALVGLASTTLVTALHETLHAMVTVDQLQIQQEVEAWVAYRLRSHDRLFSPEIAPSGGSMFEFLSKDHAEGVAHFVDARVGAHVRNACRQAVIQRRLLTRQMPPFSASLAAGKWLVFDPSGVDFCGLANDPGFVDEADAPAWDLWVACLELPHKPFAQGPRLVSWVPGLLVDRFDLAVRCSVLEALTWANDHELERLGRLW